MSDRQLTKPDIDPNKNYVMCSICGWLVPEDDITLEFDGLYADYTKHSMGKWHMIVCSHCQQRLDEIEKQGEHGALMRMGKAGAESL